MKAYRLHARIAAMCHKPAVAWASAQVQFVFTFANAVRRDRDNLLATMKSAIDGLADAGLVVNDADFVFPPVIVTEPCKNKPQVKIIITKLEEQPCATAN